ncbi:MAG: hypothetical protein ABIN58_07565, partial [candidate division WOR-3 bacterium]
ALTEHQQADETMKKIQDFRTWKTEWEEVLREIEKWNGILKEFESMIVSEKREELQRKLNSLKEEMDRVQEYLRLLKELPQADDLNRQLQERRHLMDLACLQHYLIGLEDALRKFDHQSAEWYLKQIDNLKGTLGESAVPYQGQIEFLTGELQAQASPQQVLPLLTDLAQWRNRLDQGQPLDQQVQKDLARLTGESRSIFIQELYNLAHPPEKQLPSYEQAQAQAHEQCRQWLAKRNLEELEKCLGEFDGQWRSRLTRPEAVRHDQFIATWSNWADQARTLDNTITALTGYLEQGDRDLYHLAIWIARIESITDQVSPGVLAAYGKDWEEVVTAVARHAGENMKWGLNSSWVQELTTSLEQKIQNKKEKGKRFLPPEEEQETPAGQSFQPTGFSQDRRR